MITRIEGQLVGVGGGRAQVRCGALTYEVLVPAADEGRLATMVDETVGLDTLHYMEAQGQGSSFTPRLIGFASARDRSFFELFTTVKGVGNRKALRALTLPFAAVAEAIATADTAMLKSLPEIGARTAQTIVAELSGKVDGFRDERGRDAAGEPALSSAEALLEDTARVLAQLGEPPSQARRLAERALRAEPEIDTADALLAAAFRLKEPV